MDNYGNTFESICDMCDFYNINPKTFHKRGRSGYSLQNALENPLIKTRYIYDHKGNKFRNIREMCSFWGITEYEYYKRKHCGLTLRKILEGKLEKEKNTNKNIHIQEERFLPDEDFEDFDVFFDVKEFNWLPACEWSVEYDRRHKPYLRIYFDSEEQYNVFLDCIDDMILEIEKVGGNPLYLQKMYNMFKFYYGTLSNGKTYTNLWGAWCCRFIPEMMLAFSIKNNKSFPDLVNINKNEDKNIYNENY